MKHFTKTDLEKYAGLIRKLEKEKKELESKITSLKSDIQEYMTNSSVEELDTKTYLISYKHIVQNRLDTKKLKEEKPELYEDYLHEVPSSRFTVKEK